MPITLIESDISWSEKKDRVEIRVPLKGCSPSSVDIFVTATTLKVNFSPYLLDLLLKSEVDSVKHKATVKSGVLVITLLKVVAETWGGLTLDVSDKSALNEIKKSAIEKQNEKEGLLQSERKDRRIDDEKHALRKQMKLDEGERSLLENLKQEEKDAAEEAMYKTFADMEKKSQEAKIQEEKKQQKKKGTASSSSSTSMTKGQAPKKAVYFDNEIEHQQSSSVSDGKDIFNASEVTSLEAYLQNDDIDVDDEEGVDFDLTGGNSDGKETVFGEMMASATAAAKGGGEGQPELDEDELGEAEEDDEDIKFVPPPRSAGYNADTRVEIKYTPRVFPTPMRESKASEEEDWIAKNRQNLKKHAILGKGVKGGADVSESDPVWLKAKADDFFRSGDTRSALNAYSAAIDIDDQATACYSNRAACYMKLNLYSECKVDCDTAISQTLKDGQPQAGNRDHIPKHLSLSRLYLRRGTSSCKLGSYADAIADFSKVVSVCTQLEADGIPTGAISSAAVQEDLSKLRRMSDADVCKRAGDEAMGQGDLEAALGHYDETLELLPCHVGGLSNRSACKMSRGDAKGCVEDCTAALELLQMDTSITASGGIGAHGIDLLSSVLPPPGSEKRLSWVVKTVVRRGAAYASLNELDKAVADYTTGSSLDPKNETLRSDLTKITNYRTGMKELEASKIKQ